MHPFSTEEVEKMCIGDKWAKIDSKSCKVTKRSGSLPIEIDFSNPLNNGLSKIGKRSKFR